MHACSASAQAGASGRYCRGRHRCVPGYVRALGADRVIDTKSQHLAELSIGADIVIDTVGGQDQDQLFGLLRPGHHRLVRRSTECTARQATRRAIRLFHC